MTIIIKICSKCNNNFEPKMFYRDKSTKDGLTLWCKSCKKIATKTYRKNNKGSKAIADKKYYCANRDKIREYHKKYRDENAETISDHKKQWYNKNKSKVIARVIKNHYKRLKEDLNYKIACYMRCRLNSALKNNYKSGSAVRDLGCSVDYLIMYLENKFTTNMTWNNYGTWHIDHIIPLASFNLQDRNQFLKACHYTNLQPLWATENLKKGARLNWGE